MPQRVSKIALRNICWLALALAAALLLGHLVAPSDRVAAALGAGEEQAASATASTAAALDPAVAQFGPVSVVEVSPWHSGEARLGYGVVLSLSEPYHKPFTLPGVDARGNFDREGHLLAYPVFPENSSPPASAWVDPSKRIRVRFEAGNLLDLIVFVDMTGSVIRVVPGPNSDVRAEAVAMEEDPIRFVPLRVPAARTQE